jgi:hypothetical protein
MIQISFEEALARLADDDPLEVRVETIPNNGVTIVQMEARDFCIARLRNNNVWETGIKGQNEDLGINIVTLGSQKAGHLGLVNVFFKTKPECRLNEEQLAESVKRRAADSLFSTKATTE